MSEGISEEFRQKLRANKEWARKIHEEALSLVSNEWETLPQIMRRKESDTRPDLIRRALLDNSAVETRTEPPDLITEYRRKEKHGEVV